MEMDNHSYVKCVSSGGIIEALTNNFSVIFTRSANQFSTQLERMVTVIHQVKKSTFTMFDS